MERERRGGKGNLVSIKIQKKRNIVCDSRVTVLKKKIAQKRNRI